MFCPKCGTKALDGAEFCQKCGAKLIEDASVQPAASDSTNSIQMSGKISEAVPKKKKSKKLLIILAIVFAFIVILIIANADDWAESGKEYERQEEYIKSQQASADVDLSETYTNEEEGISFKYPADWEISEGVSSIVEMFDSKNAPDHRASLSITNVLDSDPFGIFTDDADSIKDAVNEFHTFISIEDDKIGEIPVRILKYSTKGLNGNDIVRNCYYIAGGDIYLVIYSYTESTTDTYEKLFDAIIGSYRITEPSHESYSEGQVLFRNTSLDTIFSLRAVDVMEELGMSFDRDDDIRLYTTEIGTVESAEIWNLGALTIDGNGLDRNRDGLIAILGEPIEEGYSSGYFMRYQFSGYSMYFELGEADSPAWRVTIWPYSGYQDSIEDYWRLSGFYNGGTDMSTLSISIYSFQEEGEIAIGNAEINLDGGQYYSGLLIPIEGNEYKVEAGTQAEILLLDYTTDDIITLRLYIDGILWEEYCMKEHYES